MRSSKTALAFALALASTPAAAQTLNFSGTVVTNLTPGPPIRMTGSVTDIPIGQESDFKAYVQGIEGTKTTIGAGMFTFYVDLPLDTSSVYGRFYSQPFRIAVPILAELFQISTATVIDREKTFVWDLRRDELTIGEPAPTLSSLATQITARGVDRLEPVFLSTLPRPDTATLNQNLSDDYAQPHQDFVTDTGYFSSPKACIAMENASSAFQSTSEFTALNLAALAQYGTYLFAKSTGAPTAGFCVKKADFFQPTNWEVCVGRLEGDLTRVEVNGGVRAVDLAVDASGLTSDVTLGEIAQNVDVTLRDVSIRWKGNPFCLLRAAVTANVAESTITSDPVLDEWAACRDVNARARSATTVAPIGLPLAYTAVPEEFDVRDAGNVSFDIPGTARTPRNLTGTCGLSFIRPSARSLMQKYYDPLEATLGSEWLEASPTSEFAGAANLLLSPVEHGTFDAALDHDVQSDVFLMGTLLAPPGVPGEPAQTVDGVWFWLSTEAELKPGYAVAPVPGSFVSPPLGPIPWSDDGYSNHLLLPVPFDLSFSTTTVALNQVLRERSATAVMNFTIPTVAGAPTLGDVLSIVNPTALAPLTSPTVEWRVAPSSAPFTYMPRDPPFPGNAPIVYQLQDLVVTAIEPGVGGAADILLLQLKLDFLDPSLGLGLSPTLGDTFLVPTVASNALFVATIAESHLPGCPMALHTIAYVKTCDRAVEALASVVLKPLVNGILESLLSTYPAPQFFDAKGEAAAPTQIRHLRNFQDENWITLYAAIPQP